jgi:hypothetical protein
VSQPQPAAAGVQQGPVEPVNVQPKQASVKDMLTAAFPNDRIRSKYETAINKAVVGFKDWLTVFVQKGDNEVMLIREAILKRRWLGISSRNQ